MNTSHEAPYSLWAWKILFYFSCSRIFYDTETNNVTRESHYRKALQSVLDQFVMNCRTAHSIDDVFVAIYETLVAFRYVRFALLCAFLINLLITKNLRACSPWCKSIFLAYLKPYCGKQANTVKIFIFNIVGANGKLTIGKRYMHVYFYFRFDGKQIVSFRIRSNYKFVRIYFAIINCFPYHHPSPPSSPKKRSKLVWENKRYGSKYEVQLLRSNHMKNNCN